MTRKETIETISEYYQYFLNDAKGECELLDKDYLDKNKEVFEKTLNDLNHMSDFKELFADEPDEEEVTVGYIKYILGM